MLATHSWRRHLVLGVGCCLGITAGIVGSVSSLQNDIKHRLSISQKHSKYQRGHLVLGVGCCLGITAGIVGSVSSLQNDIKHRLSISQKHMELLVSMSNLGFNCGLPGGLVLERWGAGWSSLAALLTALTGYLGFDLAMRDPGPFSAQLFPLLVVFFFVTGLGSTQFFMNGIAVNTYNYRVQHRGRVIGLVSSCYFIGYALYSVVYRQLFGETNIPGFILFCMCMVVLVNALAMVLLRKLPADTETTTDNKNHSETATNSRREEKSQLLGVKSLKCVHYGELDVCHVLKTADFHLLLWPFIISFSVSFMYSFNLQVFLTSFRHTDLLPVLTVIGPVVGACGKLGSGLASDFTLKKFPRIMYLISALTLQTTAMLLSCFLGHLAVVTTATIVVQFASLAMFMAVVPIIIADSYGTTFFASILGTALLFGGLGCLVTSFSMGALYDVNTDDTNTTCFGLHCFRAIFLISTCLCVSGLVMLICLYKRQNQRYKQQQGLTLRPVTAENNTPLED